MTGRNTVSFHVIALSLVLAGIVYILFSTGGNLFTGAQSVPPGQVGLKVTTTCSAGVPSATLTWANPNGAKSYTVFRNPNSSGVKGWSVLASPTATSYVDSNIKVGGTYSYQVRAISPLGVEKYSSIITISNVACAVATAKTPAPTTSYITFNPTINASCASTTPQVALTWRNPNQATAFSLFRNPNSSGVSAWGKIGESKTTTYTDSTAKVGTAYRYQIQAVSPTSTRYSDILPITPAKCVAVPASTASAPTTPATPTTSTTTPTTTPNTPPPATTPTPTTPTTPTQKEYQWGVYSGWYEGDIRQFETIVGEDPDILSAFTHWGNSNAFPTYLSPLAKDKGRTLLIFWEASNHLIASTEQSDFSYDAILAGRWDSYIKSFASQAKAYGAPVILIPFSEMNGNWSPWSGVKNGNTPAKAVLAFRHVRTTFGDVANVKWGWAPNSNSVPDTAENAIEKYYPGDAYVDYVGVDGFNFDNPWMTFDQIFKKPLTILAQYNKPIYIFSFASAQGTQKAAWIKDAIDVQLPKYPLVVGWNWFNQNKERNWLVWSDNASLEAFKSVVQ
jgi:hypothetical protein